MQHRTKLRRSGITKWFERGLWVAGSLAIAYCGWFLARGRYEQMEANREFSQILTTEAAHQRSAVRAAPEGAVVGRITIPRLDLFAVVFEGTSDDTLEKGVGHLTGSSLSDTDGNIVLAAHRDTFFRPLKQIRLGDVIVVETKSGSSHYIVSSSEIVSPQATDVLRRTPHPELTLITCYPFQFFGHAPDRFIVHAIPERDSAL